MLLWGPEASDTESGSTAEIEAVVAVLPLLDLTGTGNAFLAQGLVSELQAGLAMVPGLEVQGRLSSAAYTDVNRDAAHAGATVGARVVLDGTVQHAGGRLRLALRLLDTQDRRELWSEAAEIDLLEMFDWRDSVVARVAGVLARPVGQEVLRRLAKRSTTIESFELYSSGRFRWAEGAGGDMLTALDQYDLALEADPGFAPTWTAIANTYAELPRFTRFPTELVRSDGAAAARTALQLDPDDASAHAALGQILYLYDHDFEGGRSHVERALELDIRSGEGMTRLCELEILEARIAEARAACADASSVEPLSFATAWLKAGLHRLEGDYDLAVRSLDSLRVSYPGYAPLAADVAVTRLLGGESILARRDVLYWIELIGGDARLADALWGDDRPAALNELAAELRPSASNLAAVAALLGEIDIGLRAMETAFELGEPGAVRFPVFPEYAGLRETSTYEALVGEFLSGQRDGLPADST